MNSAPPRPPTPDPVKRQLRQEAGFGCCRCGHPIYQYHHIIPYAVEPHFRPDDMMILCPLCHDKATKGAMTEARQRQHKANPYNIQRGFANGELALNQDFCAINVGGNLFVGDGTLLRVDGESLLSLSLDAENRLEVSVRLYDRESNLVACIDKNEWTAGDPLPWDIESDWRILVLRERARHISLEIDARSELLRLRANLWWQGENIVLSENGLSFVGSERMVRFVGFCYVGVGFAITTSGGWGLGFVPLGVSKPSIISEPDAEKRLKLAAAEWRKLRNNIPPDAV